MELMVRRAVELDPFLRGFILVVFYGSNFNNTFGGFVWNHEKRGFNRLASGTVTMFVMGIRDAASYRFDLKPSLPGQ